MLFGEYNAVVSTNAILILHSGNASKRQSHKLYLHCTSQFCFLTPDWLFLHYTITFHKYFCCSHFIYDKLYVYAKFILIVFSTEQRSIVDSVLQGEANKYQIDAADFQPRVSGKHYY